MTDDFAAAVATVQQQTAGSAAVASAIAGVQEAALTEDEKAMLAEFDPQPGDDPTAPNETTDPTKLPEWVVVPSEIRMPPPGRRLVAIQFEPDITEREDLGVRWCLCWSLSLKDERAATARMRNDPARFMYEMSKAMIRVIDGRPVDWSAAVDGKHGINPDLFMDQIGFIGREMLGTIFQRLHNMSAERKMDFYGRNLVFRNT